MGKRLRIELEIEYGQKEEFHDVGLRMTDENLRMEFQCQIVDEVKKRMPLGQGLYGRILRLVATDIDEAWLTREPTDGQAEEAAGS
jgi:hypothetical protein